MRCGKFFLMTILLFFGLTNISFAGDDTLQYFLSKASSKTLELSKKEKMELLNQLDEVMKRAQDVRTKLMQAVQTGETDVRYQEGKFWISRLEEDQTSIETGIQQIKLLKEKPAHLVASVKLYKYLRDLSDHLNAYNNFPAFSAFVGDLAPEIELWGDPIFYKLYLLPLAQSKDIEKMPLQKEQTPPPKGKKP